MKMREWIDALVSSQHITLAEELLLRQRAPLRVYFPVRANLAETIVQVYLDGSPQCEVAQGPFLALLLLLEGWGWGWMQLRDGDTERPYFLLTTHPVEGRDLL